MAYKLPIKIWGNFRSGMLQNMEGQMGGGGFRPPVNDSKVFKLNQRQSALGKLLKEGKISEKQVKDLIADEKATENFVTKMKRIENLYHNGYITNEERLQLMKKKD